MNSPSPPPAAVALLTGLYVWGRRKQRGASKGGTAGGSSAATAPPPGSISAVSAGPGGPEVAAFTANAQSAGSDDDGQKSAKSEQDTLIHIPSDQADAHASPPAGTGSGAPELDTFITPSLGAVDTFITSPAGAVDTFITPPPAGAVDTFLPAGDQQAPEASAPPDIISHLPSDYDTWRRASLQGAAARGASKRCWPACLLICCCWLPTAALSACICACLQHLPRHQLRDWRGSCPRCCCRPGSSSRRRSGGGGGATCALHQRRRRGGAWGELSGCLLRPGPEPDVAAFPQRIPLAAAPHPRCNRRTHCCYAAAAS